MARFPASIKYGVYLANSNDARDESKLDGVDDCVVFESVVNPYLMCGIMNENIGSDRKCWFSSWKSG